MEWVYRNIGITVAVFVLCAVFLIISFSEAFDGFGFVHELNHESFELIASSSSPDSSKVYHQYMFDQGGYGYSRVFWAVASVKDKEKNLEPGILSDGYRVTGWSKDNKLIVESFEPSYYKEDSTELATGSILNGVELLVK